MSWKWEEGMLAAGQRGANRVLHRVLFVGGPSDFPEYRREYNPAADLSDPSPVILYVSRLVPGRATSVHGWLEGSECTPVWSDRATQGCLLAQFRDRFGDHVEVHDAGSGRYVFYVLGPGVVPFCGSSRVEVMLKALEWDPPATVKPEVAIADLIASAVPMVTAPARHVAYLHPAGSDEWPFAVFVPNVPIEDPRDPYGLPVVPADSEAASPSRFVDDVLALMGGFSQQMTELAAAAAAEDDPPTKSEENP